MMRMISNFQDVLEIINCTKEEPENAFHIRQLVLEFPMLLSLFARKKAHAKFID